jgi:hypothetical protein
MAKSERNFATQKYFMIFVKIIIQRNNFQRELHRE